MNNVKNLLNTNLKNNLQEGVEKITKGDIEKLVTLAAAAAKDFIVDEVFVNGCLEKSIREFVIHPDGTTDALISKFQLQVVESVEQIEGTIFMVLGEAYDYRVHISYQSGRRPHCDIYVRYYTKHCA